MPRSTVPVPVSETLAVTEDTVRKPRLSPNRRRTMFWSSCSSLVVRIASLYAGRPDRMISGPSQAQPASAAASATPAVRATRVDRVIEPSTDQRVGMRARSSELPVEIRGDEEDPAVVEGADEVAAAAERHRQRALPVDIEVAAVRVLARDAPAERLAHQVLGAHAKAPRGVGGKLRRDVRAVLELGIVSNAEVQQPRVAQAVLRAGRDVPGVLVVQVCR